MKNIILFDDEKWPNFLPITYTRPICELRVGILTIKEKWEKHLNGVASYITQDYLSDKYPIDISKDNIVINSRWLPNPEFISLINGLELNDALLIEDTLVAARMDDKQFERLIDNKEIEQLKGIDISKNKNKFIEITQIFELNNINKEELEKDFQLLTRYKKNHLTQEGNTLVNENNIFAEEGAKIQGAYLNATDGPIYIGKNAQIMEGSLIRGPFALCESSVIKMGSKIYGGTTIGPFSKIAGEVSESIIIGYTNKAHDGYLGNSYLGSWCNLGAGTNVSNLKNNYTKVKIWDFVNDKFKDTGLQFCGLIMGDHSKAGISTMFNTGTVVGVSANIFGSGYPRTFIPSFSWGGTKGYKTYLLNKSFETAEVTMKRRNQKLDEKSKIILEHIFHNSSVYRTWES
ncbi:MAG: glucose-1-phosphate thymidylyltransferase [Saprospiraceae bacterium]|nr:GlmU family protein [Bacteroidia bacterium]NNE15404.1 glucose-1-phosphate thymidylyltransferase [Saprospiraceae bacterium]NNL92260.1 glucose-1-phosphate thymidylyltransferase [Saprospiraceae bacterium]